MAKAKTSKKRQTDIRDEIRGIGMLGFKRKVDVDEFSALERRVALLEKRISQK